MLTEARQILNSYIPIAKTIAKMFGSQCEVVIHDLTQPQSSVIFTVNNHVTGREIGQSFDHLVKQVLLSEDFKEDHLAGYDIETVDHRIIKSSTTLIRDYKQEIIGALCINYDINLMIQMKEMLNSLIPSPTANQMSSEKASKKDDSIQNVEDIADQLIRKIIANSQHPFMKRHEKIELIRFMDEKGIFLMKGSVEKVAEQLGISKVTVYSYLDEVKKQSTN
ncbi:helix-turn-helix transcriptional regulator [Priestia megaterium]|jgi:predicted transcriptional regulator YheO|uniref:helix-turn-helix transcriptional regulator n=1 Tax=Priestia megaterium TaxID=1404 RepID=UPI0003FBB4E3|nr:helix-turn-helix transcriptional regulator [Priestia megaterium]RFB33240.1 transcriptional regulator [Bacillus sp. RC]MBW0933663.1 helix-turn-helix transcriptional regulator [Priestia megaterium]MCR8866727.1 helix-turn-helix transcriptional regulator [Priestia megaterium]MED3929252.1 helix-turn-helix transcriptional regulator [Priestia megaterium]PFK69182.1 transcriptional regulator [Priestia megaterium]